MMLWPLSIDPLEKFNMIMRQTRIVRFVLLCCLTALLCVPEVTEAAGKGDFRGGAEAIRRLGSKIGRAAKSAGKRSGGDVRRILRQDKTSKVNFSDPRLQLIYFDNSLPKSTVSASDAAIAQSATFPPENTFKLHSRPGAKRIIFLDFDGHVLSNNAWTASNNGGNPINAPAFSTDSDPSTFSASELQVVQEVWQRVAEDYSPFDVDVTTEYTGEDSITRSSSGDEYYGTRALISPISSYFGNYGGIAYVGVYGNVGDYYKPALIFSDKMYGSARYIAEAVSHEVGHNLSLSHDGTTTGTEYYAGHGSGETGWAPIMGVGYYQNLTQWSRGEYSNANNREDDLARIATYVGFRADDLGDTMDLAAPLPGTTLLSADAVHSTSADIDFFRFATDAGAISISITPAAPGADMDILADLYDQSGQKVASVNPATLLAANISLQVDKGTYFLSVTGTGMGDLSTGYSNYGSLGQYHVSANVIPPTGGLGPVAVARASTYSGEAPLAVQFDATGSYDPDGNIASFEWDFGDGTAGTGSSVSHSYTSEGTYVATLVVTDNSGIQGSASLDVSVIAANVLPVAEISAGPVTGYSPLTVTFDGSASRDNDGTITSYDWTFGDGSAGQGSSVTHTFSSIANFTVTLTVTDNRGGTASASTVIEVQPDPAKIVHIGAMTASIVTVSRAKKAEVRIRIVDANNSPIPRATVTGQWSGLIKGTASAVAGTDGIAVVSSGKLSKSGTITFAVKSISANGYSYDAASNLISSISITFSSR